MNTRFYNARIFTGEDNSILRDMELWVEDHKITYVGPKKSSTVCWDREIDVEQNLLMPGFKNAHTHSPMTFLRSYADDLPLHEWLFEKMFPMEDKLKEEHIYLFSILAILEYITSGITANFDMYYMPKVIAKASVDCGFRTVLVGTITKQRQTLSELEDCFQSLNSYHELIHFYFGFHAEYTVSKEILEGIAALANKYKTPVFSHNSETKGEVQSCVDTYHMTPTQLFESLGLFNYGGGGFHCVHLTEEDFEIFKKRGLSIVTNPCSNAKLASGIMDYKKAMSYGINLAIGTDGPASNNSLDMFKEMNMTAYLSKLREMDAIGIDATEIVKMATVSSAKTMGLHDCDTLSVGKFADIIMIDLKQPNMQPEHHIIKNLVYSGSKLNVKMTMINGSILYENYKFNLPFDPMDIYQKANEMITTLLSD